MKIVILTSNAIRHKYVANMLTQYANDALVVSECKINDTVEFEKDSSFNPIEAHFRLRYLSERTFFPKNDFFVARTLPLTCKEVNLMYTYNVIKSFQPDIIFVFGSSIIKEPLLSFMPPGRFINLHLGLSPYYRGSGTNFWPFINEELDYVGSTILHINGGIDNGDIFAHLRPTLESGDNVHTVGCKVIQESVKGLVKIMDMVRAGETIPRVAQWHIHNERYYRNKDFNEAVLKVYQEKLKNGVVERFISKSPASIRLISLPV